MPKIEVDENLFFDLVGRRMEAAELEHALETAKAELDQWDQTVPLNERVLKIELNDTNRPDLWSTAGIARQLRIKDGGAIPEYAFFSREGDIRPSEYRVVVDASIQKLRPFMAGFVISGKPLGDDMLRDAIQTQEKLCSNFGRKRRSISMGMYRIDLIKWPVAYKGVDPDSVSFVPLQMDEQLTLRRIVAEHPKGKEYGHIISGSPVYPILMGADGGVLSMAPIINSADIGAVQVGDRDLLVEFTGTDLAAVCLAANIVACDFADAGYEIKPLRVDYAFDTPFGRSVTFPYYFQAPASVDSGRVSRLLGDSIGPEQVVEALAAMGINAEAHGQHIRAWPPEYRDDFIHAVDLVEDVMIGRGMASFKPERPRDFTIGRLSPIESFTRKAKDIMVGLGYQEMIYNYLGSGKDYIERMNIPADDVIRISNPMSENFEYVRPSTLPGLLQSEAVSSKAPYPHRIFEAGKVAFLDDTRNYGTSTRQRMGFLCSHQGADYNELAGVVSALLYYVGEEYTVDDSVDPRFLPGRQARVLIRGADVGVFGELHPSVLANWGITMPCVACELDLDSLL
ncbi:MAG: phenylalanine--tRNA ligase subunit beta [Spirochaetes bacterium GWB1_59_5]|nr:MAG: phenylalanine--tRNA ligase subunit beta [Spirochaetes bacterium GWB1_59_5]